jgi:poly-gamma-glutamate synthesis protein (capsule biosynthesis protein)
VSGALLLTGDLILDEPDPDGAFDHARRMLCSAALTVGHVEVPFTVPNPNPGRSPAKLGALARAGFGVATLAANHVADQGRAGIEDTLAGLRRAGLAAAGAGLDLGRARRPAIVERGGVTIGVLSFNCVGPPESWATPERAGCAYVEPGLPATVAAMRADIAGCRPDVDVLVVALHKGRVHTPVRLLRYERPLAHAAIDAGADVVVSHHAHILRGVEVHRDRPIFHGLGNFVTLTRVLNLEGNPNPAMLEWARRRRQLFGFAPDPAMPTYPFHPQSRNTMVASCEIGRGGLRSAGFVPCWIEADGRPRPLPGRDEGAAVTAYVAAITAGAGLDARFAWESGRAVFWTAS